MRIRKTGKKVFRENKNDQILQKNIETEKNLRKKKELRKKEFRQKWREVHIQKIHKIEMKIYIFYEHLKVSPSIVNFCFRH
jgi:hypothetical protein